MTYSIVARDPETGQMGIACQSQAFAVGSSVPWALPGYGVIATQSMGEPMYGELGLDGLRAGLTASEALRALRAVDPYPERRQVAMADSYGNFDAYTGEACVAAAGHQAGRWCVALANMVVSPSVWQAMVHAYEQAGGMLAKRLLAALEAAEAEGGDFRGRRSAAIVVVQAERTGRPWRDRIVDLRVDDHPEAVAELRRVVDYNERYHRMVAAFEAALDGDPQTGLERLRELDTVDAGAEPELATWAAVVLALAGEECEANAMVRTLQDVAPQFVEALQRFSDVGLLGDSADALERLLPAGP